MPGPREGTVIWGVKDDKVSKSIVQKEQSSVTKSRTERPTDPSNRFAKSQRASFTCMAQIASVQWFLSLSLLSPFATAASDDHELIPKRAASATLPEFYASRKKERIEEEEQGAATVFLKRAYARERLQFMRHLLEHFSTRFCSWTLSNTRCQFMKKLAIRTEA